MDTTKLDALKIWMNTPRKTYVVVEGEQIVGTYFLKTNQAGSGNHVCNCGDMVSSKTRGKGLATAMCQHSQKLALELGYKAMQFNFVASSNKGAVRLWLGLFREVVQFIDIGFACFLRKQLALKRGITFIGQSKYWIDQCFNTRFTWTIQRTVKERSVI